MNKHQAMAIAALQSAKGDDTYRARLAFRDMTPQEMQKFHGASGKTRAQILAEYEQHDANVEAAIAWVLSQSE